MSVETGCSAGILLVTRVPGGQRMTKWQILYINFVKNERKIEIDSFNSKICRIFAPSFNTDQL